MSRHHHIQQLITAAVAAVNPYTCTQRAMSLVDGDQLTVADETFDLTSGDLYLIAIGKAAVPMAQAAVDLLGPKIGAGIAVTKQGQTAEVDHAGIITHFAAHPVPDQSSVTAAAAIFDLLNDLSPSDRVLFLISGGASALCTYPLIELDEWQALSKALLASGCPIQAFNTVRKQLDEVKGGGLAAAAAPARIATLILSDVLGNPVDMIGSGPTVSNPQTAVDALNVLAKYGINHPIAQQALQQIENNPIQQDSPVAIIGDLSLAAEAAQKKAAELGYDSQILDLTLTGEAQDVGRKIADIARNAKPNQCLILGGETTVTLQGDGLGGRNQELALAAAIALSGAQNRHIATYATDGDDGPTPAAGAIVTGDTIRLANQAGLNAADALDRNDSYTFFSQLPDHHIITGQTGTNVNDLVFVLCE